MLKIFKCVVLILWGGTACSIIFVVVSEYHKEKGSLSIGFSRPHDTIIQQTNNAQELPKQLEMTTPIPKSKPSSLPSSSTPQLRTSTIEETKRKIKVAYTIWRDVEQLKFEISLNGRKATQEKRMREKASANLANHLLEIISEGHAKEKDENKTSTTINNPRMTTENIQKEYLTTPPSIHQSQPVSLPPRSVPSTKEVQNCGYIELKGHTAPILSIAYSTNGQKLITTSQDGSAKIWDAQSGELIGTCGEENTNPASAIRTAIFATDKDKKDSEIIITICQDGSPCIYELESGNMRPLEKYTNLFRFAILSPDRKKIATAMNGTNALKILSAGSGNELCTLIGHQGQVKFAAFSADSKRVITVAKDSTRLWDMDGKEIRKFGGQPFVQSAAFSPDGKKIVTTGITGFRIWDVKSGCIQQRFDECKPVPSFAIFSPSSQAIAMISENIVRIIDVESGKKLQEWVAHGSRINSLVFSPDGKKIATASYDKTSRIWPLKIVN